MKNLYLLIFLLFGLSAYPQAFWGKFQGGANIDETLAVTGDENSFTYATGYFSSTAAVNNISLTVSGLTDVFVSKVSALGATQWSVKAGGAQSDRGLGVAVDGSGNVVVCGFYTGSISFGGGISLTANGSSQDAFVAKYNPSGQIIWARSGGSSGNSDRANAVAVDGSGNIVITGQFSGAASFGSFNLTGTGTTNDIFIVKYDADGTELWAKQGSGNALNRGLAITTDNQGAVYATGQFSGDITFDNTYTNTILNALFLVKYTSAGDEAWFRYAGGSSQSIGYGLANNGTNVYLTGDCGETLTFFNGTGTPAINSGYDNAVFVAAYSQAGVYLWGESQGSDSPVSARGISHRNGELAIAGWHECTFSSLSEEYGEGLFNSIGFKDAYVMRYSTSGDFLWARNFGSPTDETVSGIYILPDNLEVVSGTFSGQINFAIRHSLNPGGILPIADSPNPGLTYCGDAHYGEFSRISGSQGQDGFLAKAIDLERAPYDFYHREIDGACDLSIPESCITYPGDVFVSSCQESLIGCQPFSVTATNYANFGGSIGFGFSGVWTPGGVGINQAVTGPGEISVVLTSDDGCYTSTASAFADIYPEPDSPLMSDDQGVNTLASSTFPVTLCPGDTALIWSDFGEVVEFGWTGANIAPGTEQDDTLVVTMPGAYQMNVVNEFGCGASNFILVLFEDLPPDTIDPYIVFNAPNDTISICQGDGALAFLVDSLTGEGVDPLGLTFNWSIAPDGFIGGAATGGIGVPASGWYTVSVEIETNENPCYEQLNTYFASDSVYIEISELPSVFLDLTGPAATCPGDTLTFFIETDGILSFDFEPIENFGDSIWVSGVGVYEVTSIVISPNGCQVIDVESLEIGLVQTPEIISEPETAIICPGDSVLLSTDSPGNIFWQGPAGLAGTEGSVYVNQAGLYFAEVVFYPGCGLVSNTLQIAEYATPFISSSNAILCPGDTITISVVSTTAGGIEWLPPLTGNDTTQVITEPGIYTAVVSGCGISTEVSIVVELSVSELFIEQADEGVVCDGDSILVVASPGLEAYEWSPTGSGDSTYFFGNAAVQVLALDTNGCSLESNILNLNFEPLPPTPLFEFELVCEGEAQIVSVVQGFDVSWTDGAGGAVLSGQSQVQINPFNADTTLYAFLSSAFCAGPVDSVSISPKPFPEVPVLGTNAPVCIGQPIILQVVNDQSGVLYTWTGPTGISNSGPEVNFQSGSLEAQGLYGCLAELDGCAIDPEFIDVSLFVPRTVSLPGDTALCLGTGYTLRPDTVYESYLWQDGSTDSLFLPEESGDFFLTVTDINGCSSSAFTNVLLVNCEVIVPNIFTPNGDGRNDTWEVFAELPGSYNVIVYNRWGQKVYESLRSQTSWDGTNMSSGESCPDGVYYYIVNIQNFEGIPYNETGSLTLKRD